MVDELLTLFRFKGLPKFQMVPQPDDRDSAARKAESVNRSIEAATGLDDRVRPDWRVRKGRITTQRPNLMTIGFQRIEWSSHVRIVGPYTFEAAYLIGAYKGMDGPDPDLLANSPWLVYPLDDARTRWTQDQKSAFFMWLYTGRDVPHTGGGAAGFAVKYPHLHGLIRDWGREERKEITLTARSRMHDDAIKAAYYYSRDNRDLVGMYYYEMIIEGYRVLDDLASYYERACGCPVRIPTKDIGYPLANRWDLLLTN
jgi:hypothetical protein